jgi:hypothetical protein
MKKQKKILAMFMFCVFTIATASAGLAAGHYRFSCDLYESKVGPKPSDTVASGTILFHFDELSQELIYQLRVEKIEGVYMAHIHMGASNKEGLLAAWLYPPRQHNSAKRTIEEEFNGTLAEGVIRQEDLRDGLVLEDLIESLRSGNAYVNIHTRNFIMGELRGQVETDQYVGLRDEDPGC